MSELTPWHYCNCTEPKSDFLLVLHCNLLQIAGSQVKKATETLVKAAEESIVNVNTNAFGVGVSHNFLCYSNLM